MTTIIVIICVVLLTFFGISSSLVVLNYKRDKKSLNNEVNNLSEELLTEAIKKLKNEAIMALYSLIGGVSIFIVVVFVIIPLVFIAIKSMIFGSCFSYFLSL